MAAFHGRLHTWVFQRISNRMKAQTQSVSASRPLPEHVRCGEIFSLGCVKTGMLRATLFAAAAALAAGLVLQIKTDSSSVGMGRSVVVSILVTGAPGPVAVWPYVNGSQWGSYATCASSCSVVLPLPHVGTAVVQAAVLNLAPPPVPAGFMVSSLLKLPRLCLFRLGCRCHALPPVHVYAFLHGFRCPPRCPAPPSLCPTPLMLLSHRGPSCRRKAPPPHCWWAWSGSRGSRRTIGTSASERASRSWAVSCASPLDCVCLCV